MRRVTGATLAILVGLILLATPVSTLAEEPAKTDTKKDRKDDVPVYTNEDLKRLYGSEDEEAETDGSSDAAPAGEQAKKEEPGKKGKPDDDPLKWLEERKARQADKAKRVAEAEQAVDAARRRLENLETQLLATRNPFSRRPELSDEEKEARRDTSETAAERHQRTQRMVEEARAELEAAEEKLRQVRAERVK